MNLSVIGESLPLYVSGTWLTLQLLACALLAGLAAAIPLAVARNSAAFWLRQPVWAFTYVIRGTPLLVQLFLVYYGLAQFPWVRESVLWPYLSSAAICAVLAFSVNTAAYTTEIIAGAMRTVPAGEVEAAKSFGMSTAMIHRRILLPQALCRALPAYSNEAIMMLHGTSLASVVTLTDLTGAAREVNSRHYLPFEAFITAAFFYLALTGVLVALFRLAERRWLAFAAPRVP
jgi:arginine/ornithine transport system permease protein